MANTWPKITARYGYAMVTKGKERENPWNLLVAATFEKAITYVFAERIIRNAEARSSTLLCSTNKLPILHTLTIATRQFPLGILGSLCVSAHRLRFLRRLP